jgi:hypothetical protein
MTDERRYDDEQVSRLLARAASHAEHAEDEAAAQGESKAVAQTGLTLAQVEEIATAVGIPADAVRRAAAAEARGDLVPTTKRTALGIPFGVARQVELPRLMTDVEWDRVVVRLRETFGAEGRVTREGSIRGWRNGNLRVVLEPTASGSRIRMSTMRGDASWRTRAGLGALGVSATMATLLPFATGATARNWSAVGVMAVLGVTMLARNLLSLPRWARIRAEQMEALSTEIGEIVDGRG